MDFERSPFAFLEAPWFLLAVLALAVAIYAAERRAREESAEGEVARPERDRHAARLDAVFFGAPGLVLGALLFAGSLAEGGSSGWPGLVAGAVCAALGYVAVAGLFARARRRADAGAAALLDLYVAAIALALAAAAIFAQPVGLVAIVAFAVLALRSRAADERKYGGLRILR